MTLTRIGSNDKGVFGELFSADPELKLYTLEHSYGGVPKLLAGTYTCRRGAHRLKHGPLFETFEICGVEGHNGILFHVGNFNADSDGCVLVGVGKDENGITQSRIAFSRFMEALKDVEKFTLTVVNA